MSKTTGSTATSTASSMVQAIAAHRDAHERYRCASMFVSGLPSNSPGWAVADEASTAASDALDEALKALATRSVTSVADVGALAVHLHMILSTSRQLDGDGSTLVEECFEALACACMGLAGREAGR